MKNTMKNIFACAAAVLILALSLAATPAAQAGGPLALANAVSKTISQAQLKTALKGATPGRIAAAKTQMTFTQKAIRLVATTGPESDMLSYRMDGLRNPTLVVPKGATLKVLFVNVDGDMDHNIRFGAWHASYPNVADRLVKTSVGTPPLPHGTETRFHAEELTLHVPAAPGKYAYFCTVRGHAQGGMYGLLLVK